MNRKFVLIAVCAMVLAVIGLQAQAQHNPNQQPPQASPSQPAQQTSPAQPAPDTTNPSTAVQSKEEGIPPHIDDAEVNAKVEARLQHLSAELSLTDDQKQKIKVVLHDMFTRLQAVKSDTHQTVDSRRSKMDEIGDAARGEIRQFLTPEQNKKLDTMKEANGDEHWN